MLCSHAPLSLFPQLRRRECLLFTGCSVALLESQRIRGSRVKRVRDQFLQDVDGGAILDCFLAALSKDSPIMFSPSLQ